MTTTTTTILDYLLLLSLSSYLLKTMLGNLSSLKEGFRSLWALKIIGCLFLIIVARPIWNILFSSHTPRDSKLPQIRTFLPLGIDYITRGIIYSAQNKSLVFWEELFRKYHPSRGSTGASDRHRVPGSASSQGIINHPVRGFRQRRKIPYRVERVLGRCHFHHRRRQMAR